MTASAFTIDIEAIRDQTRRDIKGVADADSSDQTLIIIRLLNEVLATVLVCEVRYRGHYYAASSIGNRIAASEFLNRADEHEEYADKIAARISWLGGVPDFAPPLLKERSPGDYHSGDDIMEMLKEDLVAARIATGNYRQIAAFVGEKDPETRRLLEEILAQQEEHAEDLVALIEHIER